MSFIMHCRTPYCPPIRGTGDITRLRLCLYHFIPNIVSLQAQQLYQKHMTTLRQLVRATSSAPLRKSLARSSCSTVTVLYSISRSRWRRMSWLTEILLPWWTDATGSTCTHFHGLRACGKLIRINFSAVFSSHAASHATRWNRPLYTSCRHFSQPPARRRH